MAEPVWLTLGFVGEQEVNRTACLYLLADFVTGFQKQHRKSQVRVIIPDALSRTTTIADIEDWAQTSGYEVMEETVGGIVTQLIQCDHPWLLLVGDPSEDDTVYAVAEEAAKYNIETRTLLNGLEKVMFDDEEFEDGELPEGFHETNLDPEEDEELLGDMDDDMVGAPVDLDVLAVLADEGAVDAQEELKDIAANMGIDTAPFETWADAVLAIRGVKLDQADVDDDVDGIIDEEMTEQSVVIVTDGDEVVELTQTDLQEINEAMDIRASVTTPSREALEAMSFDDIKKVGEQYGIASGRGMKHAVFVKKILEATGQEAEAAPKKNKKAPKLEVLPDVVAEDSSGITSIAPAGLTPEDKLRAVVATLRDVAFSIEDFLNNLS